MDWLERGLQQALREDGRRCLEQLLNASDLAVPGDATRPGERRHAERPSTVESIFGPLTLRRNYYSRQAGGEGRAPLDEALGIVEGCTPALARLLCRAGALEPFAAAGQSLLEYSGLQIVGRRIQRVIQKLGSAFGRWNRSRPPLPPPPAGTAFYVEADGTGIPVRPEETQGRKGKGPAGAAKTREIKVGVMFTQKPLAPNPAGQLPEPERNPGSTRYVASTKDAKEFGAQLRAEAQRQGIGRAALAVFLGDGAAWVWELARVCFPFALLILDFFHAAEHVDQLTEILFGKDTLPAKQHRDDWLELLKEQEDGVQQMIQLAQQAMPQGGQGREAAQAALAYFERNQDKMRYAEYRRRGLFIGSGVVEAGCKSVVGQRLKQSGMFWSLKGAENILDIRCVLENEQFDQFWGEWSTTANKLAKAA
jgi:hypothetical protein